MYLLQWMMAGDPRCVLVPLNVTLVSFNLRCFVAIVQFCCCYDDEHSREGQKEVFRILACGKSTE